MFLAGRVTVFIPARFAARIFYFGTGGILVVRVHDVAEMVDVVRVTYGIRG